MHFIVHKFNNYLLNMPPKKNNTNAKKRATKQPKAASSTKKRKTSGRGAKKTTIPAEKSKIPPQKPKIDDVATPPKEESVPLIDAMDADAAAAFYAASLGRTTPPLPVLQPLFTLKSPPEAENLSPPSHLTCEAASALTELAGFPNVEHPFILPVEMKGTLISFSLLLCLFFASSDRADFAEF